MTITTTVDLNEDSHQLTYFKTKFLKQKKSFTFFIYIFLSRIRSIQPPWATDRTGG